MSPQILHHVQKQGRRGRPRKYAQDGTRLKNKNNSTDPSATQLPIEQKPSEERSYKDFYPDLNIKEPLTIVKMAKNSNEATEDEKTVTTSTETTPMSTETQEEQKQDEEEEEDKMVKLPVPSYYRVDREEDDEILFERPTNHYIRYREPTETDLLEIIEYDMDEQDDLWLGNLNKERQRESLGQVSNDLFENIIDQLEKSWFDLVKNLPKKIHEEPTYPEDSKCAICDDGECENSNAIVFCDGCNLAVHQDCYGIPYIPEGQWLCRKCMVSPENPVSCIFCPNEGGAFKQTTTNQWGHLICAIWIPEVGLSNSVYMEPIDNIENIPKNRWKLTCYICRCRHRGACIQCDNKHCFVAFHATCARWARLCMRMKTGEGNISLKAYCDRHTPREYKELVDVDKNIVAAQRWFANSKRKHNNRLPRRRYVDEEEEYELYIAQTQNKKKQRGRTAVNQLLPSSKAARAHQHEYSSGAPIAPEYIFKKIEDLNCVRQATKLRKKQQLITSICRYWSLKRESRRGTPLLKRLHLEPWTASSSQLKQSEVEKAQKASMIMNLRGDIEKVRMLSEQVQKREKQKLERVRKQMAYIETIMYPVEYIIRPILEHLIESDKKELFRYPVTPELAADYYDIIKSPMSFEDVLGKLSSHIYEAIDEFEADLSLIWTNSMTYNKADTPYYRAAHKLQNLAKTLLSQARIDFDSLELNNNGVLNYEIDPDLFSYNTDLSVESTALEENKENQQEPNETETSEKKEDVVEKDAKADEKVEKTKKVETKKPRSRVTRSNTERNKRTLRSRSITKDTSQPVKIRRTTEKEFDKTSHDVTKEQQESPKDSQKQASESVEPEGSVQSDKSVHSEKSDKSTQTKTSAPVKKLRSNTPKLKYEDGEIVWARVVGFPPHPATLVDRNSERVPPKILSQAPEDKLLVEFFMVREIHIWGWVKKEDLHAFGDPELDVQMLKQAKRKKRSARIAEVKNGYKHVCQLKKMDPNPQLILAFGKL